MKNPRWTEVHRLPLRAGPRSGHVSRRGRRRRTPQTPRRARPARDSSRAAPTDPGAPARDSTAAPQFRLRRHSCRIPGAQPDLPAILDLEMAEGRVVIVGEEHQPILRDGPRVEALALLNDSE